MPPPCSAQPCGASAAAALSAHLHPQNPPALLNPAGSSHYFDDSVMFRWLQSAGLQHLAAPLSAAALDHRLLPNLSVQDYARYGVESPEDKRKLYKLIKSISTNTAALAASPAHCTSMKQSNWERLRPPELESDLSPGILDLHAMDTDLLSDVAVSGQVESCSPFIPILEQGFENDLEVDCRQQCSTSRFSRSATMEKDRVIKDNGPARIKVVVRKRPINKKELARNEEDIICVNSGCSLSVHEPKLKVDLTAYVEKHEFIFDAVLNDNVSNEEVYRITVEPIVPTIFQRTKATCFAYGQTGSGKTFTMQPLPLKAAEDILHVMHQPNHRNQGYQLWLSFFEIYGGKLFDLLNERSRLCMREDGRQQVCIVGLKEFKIHDVDHVKEYIEKGSASRSTGMTGANEESSRSHAILQLSLKRISDGNDSKPARVGGKLSFIDLAGSERGADTNDNDRQTRLEGAEINKSLLALKECIRALDSDQGHVPFRGSKLTEVLRDSFVGDSCTVMISCISPTACSCEHTLNTLRYADRVKGLSKNNNPKRDMVSLLNSQQDFCELAPDPPAVPHVLKDVEGLYLSEDGRQGSQQNCREDQSLSTDHRFDVCRDGSGVGSGFSGILDNGADMMVAACIPVSAANQLDHQQRDNAHTGIPSWQKGKGGERFDSPQIVSRKEMQEEGPKGFPMAHVSCCNSASLQQTQPGEHYAISVLLKEEDALVFAHCKEVEDTIKIVHEQEMNLLAAIDQPGSQISQYISQLNQVLAKKAAGLVNFQAHLARFQQLLHDQEILGLQSA